MHTAYDNMVTNRQLLPTDRRSLTDLKAKFSKEKKCFMLHVAKRNRLKQSGVSRDAIDECTDFLTVTTDIFLQYHYDERPAINPEYVVSSGDGDAATTGERG